MTKNILFIVFLGFYTTMYSQIHEVGFSFGGTNYVGDIGKTSYFLPDNVGGNIFYKYNINPRVAARATYSFLPILGDDAQASTDFRKDRGLEFTNFINELAVGIEYNFYEYDLSSLDKTWTPYILFEIAGFNYTAREVGATEPTNKYSVAIPCGIGYKSKLFRRLAFSVETKFRYTFTDDLDSNFNRGANPNAKFEGTDNDWYMYSGFSLIYTFGRPACYKKGF